tara:strand:- start:153 stop:497 length:345 start_codon:yes stop_codon:yes gene_type:complete
MTDCTKPDYINVKYARKYLQHQTVLSKKYFTRNEEYLKNRNRTHRQNQFSYLVKGEEKVLPGGPNTEDNMYRNTIKNMECDNVENSPINYKFGVQGPISHDLRLTNLKRHLYKR